MSSEKSSSLHGAEEVCTANIVSIVVLSDSAQKHIENILHHGGKDGGINVAAVLEDSEALENAQKSKEVRRVVRKIDLRLLPVLATIYSFALIDRVNLPNARIAGMDEDLGLSIGNRYTLISMMFFVPYVLFQFPANIAIRKIGAGIWLPGLASAWGAVTLGMGFTKSWTVLLGCRVLLGILEAGYVCVQSSPRNSR